MAHVRVVVSVIVIAVVIMSLYVWCYEDIFHPLLSIWHGYFKGPFLEIVLPSGEYLRAFMRQHAPDLELFMFVLEVLFKLVIEWTCATYWGLWLCLMELEVSFLDLPHTLSEH
jgi:hypothetical protein